MSLYLPFVNSEQSYTISAVVNAILLKRRNCHCHCHTVNNLPYY